ncbi:MAG: HupE/UreJ family protein [Cyanobacteria bacterium J06614_10]
MRTLNLSALFRSDFRYFFQSWLGRAVMGLFVICGLLSLARPALAHHPLGGRLPTTAVEGFLSGVGHPVIGLDHLAFVIAAGLLAATRPKGLWIPVTFVVASLLGTGLHLQLIDLPAPEAVISASVLAFGCVLAVGKRLSLGSVLGLGAIAGLFHGYAYGEAVFGAESTPLVAYLVGFATVQMAIALIAFIVGRKMERTVAGLPSLNLRFAGFTLAGIGAAFLSGVFLG